jgi:DNA-binding NtrC family response regulator
MSEKRYIGLHRVFELGTLLRDYVVTVEANAIRYALFLSGGKVSKAAQLLGMSHQTLSNILKDRQKSLQELRLPVKKRLKSVVRRPREVRRGK